jgi:hypothetical protein
MIAALDTIEDWIEEVPPHPTPQRFGNLAFREWGRLLEEVRIHFFSHPGATCHSSASAALIGIVEGTTSGISRRLYPAHHTLPPRQFWLLWKSGLWLWARTLLRHVLTMSLALAILSTYCR